MKKFSLAMALGLAACGGGGDDGPGGTQRPDLSTAQAVARHVASLNTLVLNLVYANALAPPQPPAGAKNYADRQCDSGSRSQSQEPGAQVSSEFTTQPIDLTVLRYDHCLMQDGNPDDAQTITRTFDGEYRSGSVQPDSDSIVTYDSLSPYTFALTFDNGTVSTQGSLDVLLSIDRRTVFSTGVGTRRIRLDATGAVSVLGIPGLVQVAATLGSSSEPFTVVTANDSRELSPSGVMSFDVTPDLGYCSEGEIAIDTLQPLLFNENFSAYDSGVLSLSNGADTATVTYNSDGSASISINGGAAQSVSQADLGANSEGCGSAVFGITLLSAAF